MIAFRKAHPSLCRSRFWREDVRWYGPAPGEDAGPEARKLAFALRGASQGDDDLYVMINPTGSDRVFRVQAGDAAAWRRVIDTGLDAPEDLREPGREVPLASPEYLVRARSVVVLSRAPSA